VGKETELNPKEAAQQNTGDGHRTRLRAEYLRPPQTKNVVFSDDSRRLPQSTHAYSHVNLVKEPPDGKWIAYRSDESGTDEIYVSSFPNVPGKLQVSVSGGSMPCWRGDGKELYYLTPDNKLMAAEMKEANGSLQVVATKTLFQTAAAPTRTGGSPYDVTADGKRFLVETQTSDQTSALLNVVENWTEEFRKK